MPLEMNSTGRQSANQLLVCRGTGCESQRANALYLNLQDEITKAGLNEKYEIVFTGCHGLCQMGPTVIVAPQGIFYCKVQPQDAAEIVSSGLNGDRIERLLFKDPKTRKRVVSYRDMDYFKGQGRIVLRNCGFINPEKIDDYLNVGGYEGIGKALAMTPLEVVDQVKRSGLRGRGGGGFPTGTKWEICHRSAGDQKDPYM